jgi:acetyltransferase-like isoleucine patch superfamily enzyme
MIVAGFLIWALLYGISFLVNLRWFTWLTLSPVIYLAWLLLFLRVCAKGSQRLGAKSQKPRYAKFDRKVGRGGMHPGMRTATICMFRFGFITSLPLVRTLEQVSFIRNLVWSSYSPAVKIAKDAFVWGSVLDPDLTEIGQGAVIGWDSCLAAHSFTARPDGSYVYISSPIKIKTGATIGGAVVVEHGAVIGEYAVVENMSFVAPFTVIPPGETWGGVPARCLRKAGERKESPTR